MIDEPAHSPEQLVKLIEEAINKDKELREQYQIGDKFRFVRDRLTALAQQLNEQIHILRAQEVETTDKTLSADQVYVYVHLYNAQGAQFSSWQKFLTPSAFYEHSVNRPIYADKNDIDLYLRQKAQQTQHAYLTIALNKNDILQEGGQWKDGLGNPLVKIKEGSLKLEHLHAFTYNHHRYVLNAQGELEMQR